MKRTKNIVFAFIFLVTQVSFGNSVSASGQKFELPLSKMILTGEEINSLSNEDRVIYLRALIYLAQVLEVSQAKTFDYEGANDKGSVDQREHVKKESLNIVEYYWNLFIAKSKATILGALAGGAWKFTSWGTKAVVTSGAGGVVKTRGVITRGLDKAGDIVTKGHAERLVKAEAKLADDVKAAETFFLKNTNAAGQMTKADADALARLQSKVTDSNKAIDALMKRIVDSGKTEAQVRAVIPTLAKSTKSIEAELRAAAVELRKLDDQLEKAIKSGNIAAKKQALTQRTELNKTIAGLERRFYVAGGSASRVSAIHRNANTSRLRHVLSNAPEAALIAYAGYKGAEYAGWVGGAAEPGSIGASMKERIESARDKKPGSMKKEEGYSCIYGGRPSYLKVNTGAASLSPYFCTKPEGSEDGKCKSGDGNFKCSSYGFFASEESLNNLCVKRWPLATLTQRCMDGLTGVIENEEKNTLDLQKPEELEKFNENVRKVLEFIEGDIMSTEIEEGKAHSFSYYCKNSKNGQTNECQAIAAFVEKLYSRKPIQDILAERARLAQNTPQSGAPASAPEQPAGAAGATDGGGRRN